MTEAKQLRRDAAKFVTEVLTEVGGKRPSNQKVKIAADKIAKAIEPVTRMSTVMALNAKRR